MRIRVNGKDTELDTALTVSALLDRLGYVDRFLAVAVNQECVLKKRYGEQVVKPGDDVEILAPMAGG